MKHFVRRDFLKVFSGLSTISLANGTDRANNGHFVSAAHNIQQKPPHSVIPLNYGPHLFVDDYLILRSENLTRQVHTPIRLRGPILGRDQLTAQPFLTVLFDSDRKLFRLWYNAYPETAPNVRSNHLAYAESEDGIHWRLPALKILGETNLLMPMSGHYGASVVDDGPECSDPSRRFKLAWWGRRPPASEYRDAGLYIAFSENGLRWKSYDRNPVLPFYLNPDDPRFSFSFGDIVDAYYNPLLGQYSVFGKTPAVPADGWLPGPKADRLVRRLVSQTVSNDFVHWDTPWRVVVPEERDEGLLEFYGIGGTIARGELLVGVVRMLRDDLPANPDGPPEGIGYATLVTSRDGEHWERHDEIFFNRNIDPEAWDHAIAWIGQQVIVGDKIHFYYGGYKQGHKINPETERQLGFARLRLDGYISRDCFGQEFGLLLTPRVRLPEPPWSALTVNAEATHGEIRVQVLDRTGQIIPGFSFEQCRPLLTDGLKQPVSWRSDTKLPRLSSRPVHLEFRLVNSRIYGFGFDRTA